MGGAFCVSNRPHLLLSGKSRTMKEGYIPCSLRHLNTWTLGDVIERAGDCSSA